MAIRSRQAARSSESEPSLLFPQISDSNADSKRNPKPFYRRYRAVFILLSCILFWHYTFAIRRDSSSDRSSNGSNGTAIEGQVAKAPMGTIVYGAKSKGEDTARLVKEAIQIGFRHIATGGFHFEYNEAGVGEGWKESGLPRNKLYLQTLFLSQSTENYGTQNCHLDQVCPPASGLSIEDQVKLSIQSSLHNLQTDYIDSVLVHNFRAKLQPYEETLAAWRVLEDYVDKGVIRHLGIVSVHDKEYLTKLHTDARIKPLVIQNRFHSNRSYDISLRPTFKELEFVQNQLFWILTGSAGGKIRNNVTVKKLADKKGVSPQVLLYSFTIQLGGAPMIGCKNSDHMKEDVDALLKNVLHWEHDELVEMAGVLNKNLLPK